MNNRHTFCHAALCVVYLVVAGALLVEGAYVHAGCALAAALVYALLCGSPHDGGGSPSENPPRGTGAGRS